MIRDHAAGGAALLPVPTRASAAFTNHLPALYSFNFYSKLDA